MLVQGHKQRWCHGIVISKGGLLGRDQRRMKKSEHPWEAWRDGPLMAVNQWLHPVFGFSSV